MFSLLKCARLGMLAACVWEYVYVYVCEHMASCVLLSMCLLSYCMYSLVSYTYILCTEQMGAAWVWSTETRALLSWSPSTSPTNTVRPAGSSSGCEVNTCLCWHKHTMNRCVIQMWGQIAAQRSDSFSGKKWRHSYSGGPRGKKDMRTKVFNP